MNLADVPITAPAGLSDAEAAARLQRDGPNRLPPPQHRSAGAVLREVLTQPMVLLLLACALLYGLLGNALDALVLGGSLVLVASISVVQALRTQAVLEALQELASPRSTVVRGGVARRIASHELVRGDRLIVQEGDRLACDALLLETQGLRLDESMLSGESMPVDKGGDGPHARQLMSGTLVVQGDGVAVVTGTGVHTALGRIGGSLQQLQPPPSRLRRQLDLLVRRVALTALATCLVAATVFAWRDGSWTAGLLVGLTLAMAIVPEEFAVVWTVMLALGAWRLARRQVLTRQPQAIEALGTASVLCVDKTGTLTCNRMSIAQTSGDAVLRWAALASVGEGLEPMDRAILALQPQDGEALLWREGVQPQRPFVRHGWRLAGGSVEGGCVVAMKGAPEAVLACCDDDVGRAAFVRRAADWAARGLRVIAVAHAPWRDGAPRPADGFVADGLIAFEDPLREDVPAALARCREAGVRVVMITGDAPATASAIARQAGLERWDGDAVCTGAALAAMDDRAFDAAVGRIAVYARVSPDQKLRIVQALQRRGEVVAMTGDGVNDGPALRAADVGVAMGQRGTDVAREAAALVLLDDRFASLVDAVCAGRRIFANLQRAVGYLLAVHLPIVGLSLLPVLGGPVLLLPVHVVLLELIIDPACSLVFEAEPAARDAMKLPPRPAGAALFSRGALQRALGVGAVALGAVVMVQVAGRWAALPDEGLRLAGLATLVVGNLAMLQWFRGGRGALAVRNGSFDLLVLGVAATFALLLLVPPLARLFGLPVLPAAVVLPLLAMPAVVSGWRLARGRRRALSGA
ncbi:cation-translocating P-type ATPase [Rhizobacter sp. OV335]|uniref:cation-translocating P-type ATPase n=1 Tax=Rhizobacter sp. OV335 TaxID=1500264 RepID=UPI00091E8DA8|nr:cation-translocating P-type ATPase [Rhizobacter sp. OV335]SHN38005.1 Ca2+-transporting ATPase [Rhizobacter sp. OV335]